MRCMRGRKSEGMDIWIVGWGGRLIRMFSQRLGRGLIGWLEDGSIGLWRRWKGRRGCKERVEIDFVLRWCSIRIDIRIGIGTGIGSWNSEMLGRWARSFGDRMEFGTRILGLGMTCYEMGLSMNFMSRVDVKLLCICACICVVVLLFQSRIIPTLKSFSPSLSSGVVC